MMLCYYVSLDMQKKHLSVSPALANKWRCGGMPPYSDSRISRLVELFLRSWELER
jgi:hypothetical protein